MFPFHYIGKPVSVSVSTFNNGDSPYYSCIWLTKSLFICSLESPQEIGDRGTQSTAEAMDNTNGNMFIGLIYPIGIGCWDSRQPFRRSNIHVVALNDRTLQFSSGVKVKRNRAGTRELWVSSNRYQKVADGTASPNETNFRVMWVEMERLVDGQSRCAGRTLD